MNGSNPKSTSPKKGKKKEVLLLIVVFVVILIAALAFYGKNQVTGDQVIVTINGEEYGRYPLNKDQEIPIKQDGEITNYLVIQDGVADMVKADCPDLLCVNMKAIYNDGETIVCLPNKVVIEVDSDTNQSELDAVIQ